MKSFFGSPASLLRRWPGVEHMPRLYDRSTRRSEMGLVKLRRMLLAEVSGAVLEMGVGTGNNLPYYSQAASVVAFDLDPRNVRYAAAKPESGGARLLAANAQFLPFGTAQFDQVVATLMLCSVPSQAATLTEVRRVLRPGGRLHLIEHTLTGMPAVDWLLNQVERPWQWATGGCHLNRDTAAALREAGWSLLKHRRYSGGFMNVIVAQPEP